jgi:hypothetical protein
MKQFADTDDPRFLVYAQDLETAAGMYRGVPNLMDANKKENQALGIGVSSTSYIGRYFTETKEFTTQVMSHAEVCFLRAEAALRGWSSEDAKTWYDRGIKSTFAYFGDTQNAADTFLVHGGAYNVAGTFDEQLEQIITQKWIVLYLNGWEAFAEYRRTGYPQLMKYDLVLDGIKIKEMEWVEVPRSYVPGRLPYPDDEADLNSVNYQAAVDRQGGDSYYQQVWWAKEFGTVDY